MIDPAFEPYRAAEALRGKLAAGPVVGPFCKTGDPAMVEAMALAGFDFCILDAEHGPNGWEAIGRLIAAAELHGMAPIVRVPEASSQGIGKALDLGAAGVQVPQIDGPDAARSVVSAARFAPVGDRGVCRYVRAAAYGRCPRDAYFQGSGRPLAIVQVEGAAALERLDDLLAVEGIDVVFVGPYDLSQSLGLTGQTDHPRVVEAAAGVVAHCREAGVDVGTFVEDAAGLERWREAGCRYLCHGVDVGIFAEACRAIVTRARERRPVAAGVA